jgi:papain fold toxin 1 (glutamine deamidase) of polymorphic toxin system
MPGGELGAVFKGLAKDAAEAAGKITESAAKLSEQTADIEENNLAHMLQTDARSADDIASVGKKSADENLVAHGGVQRTSTLGGSEAHQAADDVAGRRWWDDSATTLRGGDYYTPRTQGLQDLINPKGGQMNCRACVLAVDSTLGGAPGSALPRIGAGPIDVLEQHYGTSFRDTNLSGIVEDMTRAGDGARGIVCVSGRGPVGHVFNVINDGGKIVFLDGQTGTANHVAKWLNYKLLRTN